jgi:hypothetical protein
MSGGNRKVARKAAGPARLTPTLRSQLINHFEHNYKLPPKALAELQKIARSGTNPHVQFEAPKTVYRGSEKGRGGLSWSRSRKVADSYHPVTGGVTIAAKLPARAGVNGSKLARHVGAHRHVKDQEVIVLRMLKGEKV